MIRSKFHALRPNGPYRFSAHAFSAFLNKLGLLCGII